MSRSYSIYYYKSLSSGNCHNNKDKLGPDDINFFHTAFPYQISLIAPLNICLQLQLMVLAVQCFCTASRLPNITLPLYWNSTLSPQYMVTHHCLVFPQRVTASQ